MNWFRQDLSIVPALFMLALSLASYAHGGKPHPKKDTTTQKSNSSGAELVHNHTIGPQGNYLESNH